MSATKVSVDVNVINAKKITGVIQVSINAIAVIAMTMAQSIINAIDKPDNVNVAVAWVDTNVMNVHEVSMVKHHTVLHAVNVLTIGILF